MNSAIVAAIISAVVVVVVNAAVTLKSNGRLEGSVTKALESLGKEISEHKADTAKKFDHVSEVQGKQWDELSTQGKKIAWCEAKLGNGHKTAAHV